MKSIYVKAFIFHYNWAAKPSKCPRNLVIWDIHNDFPFTLRYYIKNLKVQLVNIPKFTAAQEFKHDLTPECLGELIDNEK